MKLVSFACTKEEHQAVARLVRRAMADNPAITDFQSACMDLEACHANGTPLDFAKFEGFDDFNFNHDFYGIARHIDRATGQLRNHFSPRCAVPRPAKRRRSHPCPSA